VADRSPLGTWWEGVRQHEAVARVDAEMAKALAEALAAGS
jgi:hypothetical protein